MNAATPSTLTCLNVEACESTIIYDGCTISGPGTCSGPGTFKNEQWSLRADGALLSALDATRCATVAASDSTLSLAACASPPSDAQTFAYVAATGELQSKGGLCLTAPSQGPPPSNVSSLLVGRRLHDGAWALLALNNAAANSTITCAVDCFARMGFAPADMVAVRDLYLHALVNTTAAGGGLDIAVGASGASTFLRITKSGVATSGGGGGGGSSGGGGGGGGSGSDGGDGAR